MAHHSPNDSTAGGEEREMKEGGKKEEGEKSRKWGGGGRKGRTSTHCVTSVILSRCHERTVPSSEQETTHGVSG